MQMGKPGFERQFQVTGMQAETAQYRTGQHDLAAGQVHLVQRGIGRFQCQPQPGLAGRQCRFGLAPCADVARLQAHDGLAGVAHQHAAGHFRRDFAAIGHQQRALEQFTLPVQPAQVQRAPVVRAQMRHQAADAPSHQGFVIARQTAGRLAVGVADRAVGKHPQHQLGAVVDRVLCQSQSPLAALQPLQLREQYQQQGSQAGHGQGQQQALGQHLRPPAGQRPGLAAADADHQRQFLQRRNGDQPGVAVQHRFEQPALAAIADQPRDDAGALWRCCLRQALFRKRNQPGTVLLQQVDRGIVVNAQRAVERLKKTGIDPRHHHAMQATATFDRRRHRHELMPVDAVGDRPAEQKRLRRVATQRLEDFASANVQLVHRVDHRGGDHVAVTIGHGQEIGLRIEHQRIAQHVVQRRLVALCQQGLHFLGTGQGHQLPGRGAEDLREMGSQHPGQGTELTAFGFQRIAVAVPAGNQQPGSHQQHKQAEADHQDPAQPVDRIQAQRQVGRDAFSHGARETECGRACAAAPGPDGSANRENR